jgi:hypothetical protein
MSGKTVFKLLEKHAIVIHSKDYFKWWDLISFRAHRGVSMGDR